MNRCLPSTTSRTLSNTSPVTVTLEELQAKALQNRPGPARGAVGRYRGQQPICTGQGEWKAGSHRLGQLLARQRHQRRHLLVQHSARDFRPQPGQYRADACRHQPGGGAAEGGQRTGADRRERRVRGLRNERVARSLRSGMLEARKEPRYQRIRVPARRHRPARFPGRRAQLSRHPTRLPAGGGRLCDLARAASPGGGNQEFDLSSGDGRTRATIIS